MRTALLLAAFLLSAPAAHATTWYVDVDAAGSGDGSSWADGFVDLQAALSIAVTGDEIWVAEGTYRPGPGEDREATFRLIDGVALYGGFRGNETDPRERSVAYHTSVLAGDINGPDPHPLLGLPADDVLHVVTATDVGASAVLDGFTIRYGNASESEADRGAGLLIRDASPTVRDCTIERCFARGAGAGISIRGTSTPLLEGLEIRHNWAMAGAAVDTDSQAWPEFRSAYIHHNEAQFVGGASGQGSFFDSAFEENSGWYGTSTLAMNGRIERCRFVGNGNVYGVSGATVTGHVDMVDCVFSGNSANRSVDDGYNNYIYTAGFRGTGTLTNVTFVNNRVGLGSVVPTGDCTLIGVVFIGDGLHTGSRLNGQPAPVAEPCVRVINCTFVDSPVVIDEYSIEIENSVFWRRGEILPSDPPLVRTRYGGTIAIRNSLVLGSGGSGPGWNGAMGEDRGGNVDLDPAFVDLAGGDFRLAAGSPAIDAGDTGLLDEWPALDAGGQLRLHGLGIDLGAFEYQDPRGRFAYAAHCTPHPINRASAGGRIGIELEPRWSFAVDRIDATAVVLGDAVSPLRVRRTGDHLRLDFARADVLGLLANGPAVPVVVTGLLDDGTPFAAADTVRVFGAAGGHRLVRENDSYGGRATSIPGRASVGAAPNPFNPSTTIRFGLPRDGFARLAVYDLSGRRVRSLLAETLPAGYHEVHWDGRDAQGRAVASGVYVALLTTGAESRSCKLVLVE